MRREARKTGEPREKPLEQGENQPQTQPTYGIGPESNLGDNGGRQVLSPLCHPRAPSHCLIYHFHTFSLPLFLSLLLSSHISTFLSLCLFSISPHAFPLIILLPPLPGHLLTFLCHCGHLFSSFLPRFPSLHLQIAPF